MKNEYDHDFFAQRHNRTVYSARKVLPIVLDVLPEVRSAIDFGCGVGTWLSVLKENGVETISGLDGPWVEQNLLEIPQEDFRQINFEETIDVDTKYDLAMTLEVAEHLTPESAAGFVDTLIRASDFVLFSAAIPFQGGRGHFNEQWPEYWAQLFAERGYVALDFVRQKIWNDSQIPTWYRQNTLLFVKKEELHRVNLPESEKQGSHAPLNLVHPSHYLYLMQQSSTVKGSFRMFLKAIKTSLLGS